MHEALFRAWRSIGSQDALIALDADQERQQVETAVTEAMAHVEAGCEARGYSLRERVGRCMLAAGAAGLRRSVKRVVELGAQEGYFVHGAGDGAEPHSGPQWTDADFET